MLGKLNSFRRLYKVGYFMHSVGEQTLPKAIKVRMDYSLEQFLELQGDIHSLRT